MSADKPLSKKELHRFWQGVPRTPIPSHSPMRCTCMLAWPLLVVTLYVLGLYWCYEVIRRLPQDLDARGALPAVGLRVPESRARGRHP